MGWVDRIILKHLIEYQNLTHILTFHLSLKIKKLRSDINFNHQDFEEKLSTL